MRFHPPRQQRRPKWLLRIQPVPKNNWGDNLAHLLAGEVWDALRREVYAGSQWKCEICHKGDTILHCHENWAYDDTSKVQTLSSLMCLCAMCHDTIHWFRTEGQVIKGRGKVEGYPIDYLDSLKTHFCKVNQCRTSDFVSYVGQMHRIRDWRSRYDYNLRYGKYDPSKIKDRFEELYR